MDQEYPSEQRQRVFADDIQKWIEDITEIIIYRVKGRKIWRSDS